MAKQSKKQQKMGKAKGVRKVLQNNAPKVKSRKPLGVYNIPEGGGFQ